MSKAYKEINNYILSFLKNDVNMTASWNEVENQKSFKKLVPKNKKKKKSPNAPVKYSSAYILFGNDERVKIKAETPDKTAQEIFKECGARWKLLKTNNKKKVEEYEKRSELDRERYLKEVENYKEEDSSDDEPVEKVLKTSKKTKVKSVKVKTVPTKKTPYLLFCEELRKQSPDVKLSLKQCGEAWKAYKLENPSHVSAPVESVIVEDETVSGSETELVQQDVKVKKTSNYNNFCKIKRQELKTENKLSATEITKELSNIWKSMSSDDKNKWN